jgi:hypothetical protein
MTIVPLPVVIAERPIPLAAECVTAPVISDAHIAPTIKSSVLSAIEVSLPIDCYVVSLTKLIRVAKTINVGVSRPVDSEVSFAVGRQVSLAINRDISFAIDRNVTSRAKLLFPLEVALAHPFVPREVSLANCGHPVLFDHRI